MTNSGDSSFPVPPDAGPAARAAILLLRIYKRTVSPLLPPACRFTPTCSVYAVEAYARHGFVRGSWLSVRRVARCQPFGGSGHDPVPKS